MLLNSSCECEKKERRNTGVYNKSRLSWCLTHTITRWHIVRNVNVFVFFFVCAYINVCRQQRLASMNDPLVLSIRRGVCGQFLHSTSSSNACLQHKCERDKRHDSNNNNNKKKKKLNQWTVMSNSGGATFSKWFYIYTKDHQAVTSTIICYQTTQLSLFMHTRS